LLGVAIVWWPFYARIVRAEVRALASRPHLEAALLAVAACCAAIVREHGNPVPTFHFAAPRLRGAHARTDPLQLIARLRLS
jgi:hypothetical protein